LSDEQVADRAEKLLGEIMVAFGSRLFHEVTKTLDHATFAAMVDALVEHRHDAGEEFAS
jgi:hypothetical protein